MNIDFGLAIVIVAVLIFYLRMIGLQREKAKQASLAAQSKTKGKKNQSVEQRYSILTSNRRDRIIAALGAAAILVGVLLNTGIIPLPGIQSYWWLPTALGIIAFSWAFKA